MNKTDNLIEQLGKLVGDDEIVLAIASQIEQAGTSPEGDPVEKAQAIFDKLAVDFPKFIEAKKPKELKPIRDMIVAELTPAPQASSTPPLTGADTNAQTKSDKLKVRVIKKIASYGGQFYDSEQQLWIGKEPVNVKMTSFVLSKLANKEIEEVK